MATLITKSMVQTRLLESGNELPLVVEPSTNCPESASIDLTDWALDHLQWIDEKLRHHGAILFRGFPLETEHDFQRFFRGVATGELRDYVGGNSPRERVTDGVFTSTSYPSQYEIPLHNEMSYANEWPGRVCFFCHTPPSTGGETAIGDSRRILQLMPDEIRERFRQRRVQYVQRLNGGWGLGKSWQEAFGTDESSVVEAFCRQSGVEYNWEADGTLETIQIRDAVLKHPITGDEVWFNQVDQWHPTSHGSAKLKSLLKFATEDRLPHNAFFGDGSTIDTADLDSVRHAYRQSEVLFRWHQGDVLLLDNVLVAHGRKPFEGERRILVAMS